MKKTFTLSISGRVFQVEEDAYALLLDYLESLSQVFKGADGREIVDDIETRISEIFQDEVAKGKIVFTLSDAEAVVATIGDAGQLAGDGAGGEGSASQGRPSYAAADACACPPPPSPPCAEVRRKLFRSDSDRVLGGVLGGLAVRFGVSVLPLRIITVLLVFPLKFFPVFIAYCVAWAIIPLADTPERKLGQQGRPLTMANIGSVLSDRASRRASCGAGTTFLRVFGALCMGFLGLVSGIVGVGMLVAVVVLLAVLAAVMLGASVPENIVRFGSASWDSLPLCHEALGLFSAICVCMAVLVPCIAMVWAACSVIFRVKGASKAVWLTALIVEAVAIVFPSVVIPLFIVR